MLVLCACGRTFRLTFLPHSTIGQIELKKYILRISSKALLNKARQLFIVGIHGCHEGGRDFCVFGEGEGGRGRLYCLVRERGEGCIGRGWEGILRPK